jgi:hypothetical protein
MKCKLSEMILHTHADVLPAHGKRHVAVITSSPLVGLLHGQEIKCSMC